jgi:hypothetical protein
MKELAIKRRKLSKEIKKTIVDLNIREKDVAYLIKNLLFSYTKDQLVEVVESDDIPIAVQIFAHALLTDYKKGSMGNAASMIQWAFERLPDKQPGDISKLSEEELDEEIQKLLDQN